MDEEEKMRREDALPKPQQTLHQRSPIFRYPNSTRHGWTTEWYFTDTSGQVHTGRRRSRRSLLALHAELDGLTWAIDCLKQRLISSSPFETDCSNILKMINDMMPLNL
ncbi:hypothetical protein AALP_AA2G040100 [Arabis alpina]|uniref:RNase H type-1 domain-containing protein n=1 Tax=Arabis alpina TaxID=50452 RepID=A0A087HF79_ARAAL|nr:hypothetical protein AALP_AA2G040100 [Arabis alpina]